jgi:SAM-dependent methyltransferase
LRSYDPAKHQREIDALYDLLYRLVHDWDRALDLSASQTRDAFATQWETLPEGKFLLSDPWFREHVDRILWEEELQIKPDWFRGRSVLDAGCGNGRWAYGFAKLGARLTEVDVNPVAVEKTRTVLEPFDVDKRFFVSPLEELSQHLPPEKYDLVFSWGVLHHCQSFTRALREVASFVADEGVLYVYLYDRDSISHADELEIFKERVRYNLMQSGEERRRFLLGKAGGDPQLVHAYHDAYAPLINRRVSLEPARDRILAEGFEVVEPTIRSTGVWLRAIRRNANEFTRKWALPPKQPPYWFQRH